MNIGFVLRFFRIPSRKFADLVRTIIHRRIHS